MQTKGVRLVLVAQIVLGCAMVAFGFLGSYAAVNRYARVSGYERLLNETNVSVGTSKILGMTPPEFAAFSSGVARDAQSAYDTLMLCGVVLTALGVLGVVLARRMSTIHQS